MESRQRFAVASAWFFAAWFAVGVSCPLDGSDIAPKRLPKEEELYYVKVDGKWGYINRQGKVVIEPQFTYPGDFRDGLARVSKDGKILYIDRTGKEAFKCPFTHDHAPFSNGFAQGSIGAEFHYVDTKGKLLPGFHASSQPFSEGMAAVGVNPDRFARPASGKRKEWSPTKWGFIDSTGKTVISADYWSVGSFSIGLAPVMVGGKPGDICTPPHGGTWGFVNKRGEFVIKPTFDGAGSFSEGLAAVHVRGKGTGYIDTSGKMVIEPRLFTIATPFQDGVAFIRGSQELGNPGWHDFGYMDRQGKVAVLPIAPSVEGFSEGLSPAGDKPTWDGKKWVPGLGGYVDKRGKWAIKPQFSRVYMFKGGVAQVELDGVVGWIDKSGKFIWPLTK